MIRRGRSEGWLSLPSSAVKPWADFSGIRLDAVKVDEIPGRGCGLVATQTLDSDAPPLIKVPRDLVLSRECIEQYAKSDRTLRMVLDGLDDFGRVSNANFPLRPLCLPAFAQF